MGSGKENEIYYSILGVMEKKWKLRIVFWGSMGLSRDHGKESGNYM